MTLRHMKIYVAVFHHSNITKAAEKLHLAQPSVSLAIKELEEYYGIRLFERMGRRILPTEGGKEFYGYALHIVSLFDEMEKRFETGMLSVIYVWEPVSRLEHNFYRNSVVSFCNTALLLISDFFSTPLAKQKEA